MTPLIIYDQIRNISYDTSVTLVSENELYSYMSIAETILAAKIGCYPLRDTSTTTASGTREYAKPTGTMQITRLTYDSYPLKQIDLRELDIVEGATYGGVTPSGNAEYYYDYGSIVGLSPIPNDTKTLTFYYIGEPATLSSSSTSFSIPSELAHYIIDYCLYRIYQKDQMIAESDRAYSLWNNNLRDAFDIYSKRNNSNRIQQVKLEDEFYTTDMGLV